MTTKAIKQAFIPVAIIFIIINTFLFTAKTWLQKQGFNENVLLLGNLLLFAVSCLSFYLYYKALTHQNTQGFLRNVYSGMLLKMFACIIAAFIYIYTTGVKNVNKPAIYATMFLYLLYTFIEMKAVLNFNKQSKK
jgi:ACR3 family arsenite efflux pump ArsB